MRRVFAIDPGVSGTGWAIIEWVPQSADDYILVDAGNIYASPSMTWDRKAAAITGRLAKVIEKYSPGEYVCEFPTFMERMVVASKTDSTVKMAFITGMFAEMIRDWDRSHLNLVLPNTWKGTMSKDLVKRRIHKKIHPAHTFKAHALDAIGIGLHYIGEW